MCGDGEGCFSAKRPLMPRGGLQNWNSSLAPTGRVLATRVGAAGNCGSHLTYRWRGLDSNFQYAEAVKLVVAAFSCADCLGRVGVLRFRPRRFERQAIRRSLAP